MALHQKYFHPVIENLGGCSEVARKLGINRSTTSMWARTGVIPAQWHRKILGLAFDQNLVINAGDFDARPLSS